MFAAPMNALPPPWQVGTDQATGRNYYYNVQTGVSQWEFPTAPVMPQPQIQAMQPQMQQQQMPQVAQQPYQTHSSSYDSRDSYRDSYNNDSYRGNGQSSYSSQSYGGGGGVGGRGRSSVDISNVPPDDQSKVRPEVVEWRKKNEITVAGDCPEPFLSFEQFPMPPGVMQCIRQAGFTAPSVIQAQGWPPALAGRDVIGVAKTGSGKTLAFLLPAFIHIQKLGSRYNLRNGPCLLTMAPTRELADQIHQEANKFGRSSNILSTCVYGGAPKGPQLRDLSRGAHVVIATPGRLNDFLEGRQISLSQVNYLVFDEADRMLDMGFEPQIRKVVAQIPSQRQTLFFTATWPKEVRKLASEFLSNPVVVYIGNTDTLVANKDVTQVVKVIDDMRGEKDQLLQEIIRAEGHGSRIIVFCSTKRMCDQLERSMSRMIPCSAIHGDKDQNERNRTLHDFKSGARPIMIATDVAARGLDVKDVKAVVNYDFPGNIEDYVHRIGRTGRAGAKGTAYTFFTRKDNSKAHGLVKIMEQAGQQIPPELLRLAGGGGQVYGSTMQFSSGGGGGFGGGGGRGRDFGSAKDTFPRDSRADSRDRRRDSRDRSGRDRSRDRRRSRSRSRSGRRRSRSKSPRRSRSRSGGRR